jgi:hypothetical protein
MSLPELGYSKLSSSKSQKDCVKQGISLMRRNRNVTRYETNWKKHDVRSKMSVIAIGTFCGRLFSWKRIN